MRHPFAVMLSNRHVRDVVPMMQSLTDRLVVYAFKAFVFLLLAGVGFGVGLWVLDALLSTV